MKKNRTKCKITRRLKCFELYEEFQSNDTLRKRQAKQTKNSKKYFESINFMRAKKLRTIYVKKLPKNNFNYKIEFIPSKSNVRSMSIEQNYDFDKIQKFFDTALIGKYRLIYIEKTSKKKAKKYQHVYKKNNYRLVGMYVESKDDLFKIKLCYPEIVYKMFKLELKN